MALSNIVMFSGDVLASPFQSSPVDMEYFRGYTIQAYITGNAAGTIWLEGSTDPSVSDPAYTALPTNWIQIKDTPKPIDSSTPYAVNAGQVYYSWVRAAWSTTTGSGNIIVRYNSKDDV